MAPEQNYRIDVDHPVFVGGAGHDLAELDLDPERPDYLTTDGIAVWIERKRQKTRFLDAHGSQVGPVHANLVPAVVWALAHGWRSPSLPGWLSDAGIAEVAANTRVRRRPAPMPDEAERCSSCGHFPGECPRPHACMPRGDGDG